MEPFRGLCFSMFAPCIDRGPVTQQTVNAEVEAKPTLIPYFSILSAMDEELILGVSAALQLGNHSARQSQTQNMHSKLKYTKNNSAFCTSEALCLFTTLKKERLT